MSGQTCNVQGLLSSVCRDRASPHTFQYLYDKIISCTCNIEGEVETEEDARYKDQRQTLIFYLTNYFFSGGHFYSMHALNLPFLGFSAPKLHTSALAAILDLFVPQTTPTH